MCEASLLQGQSWTRIWEQLNWLGVTSLPDQSELNPPGGIGLDGFTLIVEIRDRGRYRAYSYWSPVPDASQHEVRTAAARVGIMGGAGHTQQVER